ncbi:arginine repressor [Carnobacterium sp.]|uniref:arginine repressor n=1 Tax=Carnobacterium sp. TaxID=48221 RepID=UPI0038904714
MKKKDRLFTIKKLILNHSIATQQELMNHLQKENIQTTQATLSRDIKELNLIKVTQLDRTTKYTFFHDTFLEKSLYYRLEKALHNYAVSIKCIGFFVILFVRPTHPRIIASLIDELKIPAIAGTIASFDTCLIILNTEQEAQLLCACLSDIILEQSTDDLEKKLVPLFQKNFT